jgi:hypothetical protein
MGSNFSLPLDSGSGMRKPSATSNLTRKPPIFFEIRVVHKHFILDRF